MAGENKNGLVYDPNDPNYKIKPAAAMPLSSTGQQPASTPVVADGQQATATTTTGQEQQPSSTPAANQPQQATTPDVQQPVTNSDFDAQVAKMNEVIDPVTGKPKEQPVQQPTVTPSKFGFGQDGVDLASVVKNAGQNAPIREILDDYFRWSRETGNPIDYFTVNDIIHDKDISKSPAENEKERKRAENKERWDKVGNFLLHLGNVIGNVAGGGMGSVQLEDPIKYTERQRMLKEKTLEQRNSYNKSILAQMSKQNDDLRKADMDKAKEQRDQQKLENDKRRLDYYEEESKRKSYEFELKQKMEEKKLDYKKEKDELDRKLKARQISAQEYSVKVQVLKAMNEKYKAENPVQEVRQTEGRGKNKKVIITKSRGNAKPQKAAKDYSLYEVK